MCVFWGVVEGMGLTVDRSLLGWLCDLRKDCRSTSGQTGAADVLEGRVVSEPGRWGLVSRDDGMCWRRRGGLLVGGDVSVGFGLSRLPWGRGVRRVGDGGNAMCQGS